MANHKVRPRDWVILAAYVALIYSTLSMTPNFSNLFSGILGKNFGLAVDIFIISVIITMTGLFYGKVKARPLSFYLKVAAIFSLYTFLIFRWTEFPAEKLHLLEYGFLGYFVLKVASPLHSRRWAQYLYTALIVAAIGCGDEFIQKLLPSRVCDPKDMALNFISGILGLALIAALNSQKART
ncbi:MAG: VanZ family protein [Candidatus Omnitrophota bacterium]